MLMADGARIANFKIAWIVSLGMRSDLKALKLFLSWMTLIRSMTRSLFDKVGYLTLNEMIVIFKVDFSKRRPFQMLRAKLWFRCAAMHDPVTPMIVQPAIIGWEANKRRGDLH